MQSMMQVNPIAFDGAFDRLPAFRFNGASRTRAAVVVRCHLRQNAVAQSERGVAKAGEMAALQQFRISHCAGANDFRASRADARDLLPLFQRQARDLFGDAAHHLASSVGRGPALPRPRQMAGDADQRGGGSGGRDHGAYACRPDARLHAHDLAIHKLVQPLQFALARRIMLEEFAGQTHRPERQTHRIAELALARKRELATAAAQIRPAERCGRPCVPRKECPGE